MKMLLMLFLGLVANGDPAVVNSGFEQEYERTGRPSGWSFTCMPGRQNLVSYDTKVIGEQDNKALAISIAADHSSEKVAYNAHQDLQGMVAGKTYRVSAKMRSRGLTSSPIIVLQCLDATGTKYLGFSRSSDRKLLGDLDQWERVETRITVPDGTSTVRLRIGISSEGNAGGTAIIDDVVVAEAE